MLAENRDVMDKMVRLLIERETIFTEDVNMLMEGKSVEEVRDAYDKRMARSAKKPAVSDGAPAADAPANPSAV